MAASADWASGLRHLKPGFVSEEKMTRHVTIGLGIQSLPQEPQVILGDPLYKSVTELDHAPKPLKDIREVVYSASYKSAARRCFMEMEASGMPYREIKQKMLEETPFTLVRLRGELGVLPEGTALEATTSQQARICEQALLMARRREIEGFEFSDPRSGWPRTLLLEAAFDETVEIIRCDNLAPAHLLPDDLRELFEPSHHAKYKKDSHQSFFRLQLKRLASRRL